MDVYGAYLAYTDYEIGRVVQAVEDLGELDNTLIIYISGDNGASAEGMLDGTPNEFTTFNGVPVPIKAQFLFYPFWGSDRTFPHYAAEWAWAMDTPFKWVKQVPSHFGGTAQGVAMSWPGHITDVGGHPPPVPPRHRHRPHHSRGDRHPGARYRGRDSAVPDPGREHGVHLGQGGRRRPVTADDAVLRDARESFDLPRRLGGGHDTGHPAVGAEHARPRPT